VPWPSGRETFSPLSVSEACPYIFVDFSDLRADTTEHISNKPIACNEIRVKAHANYFFFNSNFFKLVFWEMPKTGAADRTASSIKDEAKCP
jgi:hypothetical protein